MKDFLPARNLVILPLTLFVCLTLPQFLTQNGRQKYPSPTPNPNPTPTLTPVSPDLTVVSHTAAYYLRNPSEAILLTPIDQLVETYCRETACQPMDMQRLKNRLRLTDQNLAGQIEMDGGLIFIDDTFMKYLNNPDYLIQFYGALAVQDFKNEFYGSPTDQVYLDPKNKKATLSNIHSAGFTIFAMTEEGERLRLNNLTNAYKELIGRILAIKTTDPSADTMSLDEIKDIIVSNPTPSSLPSAFLAKHARLTVAGLIDIYRNENCVELIKKIAFKDDARSAFVINYILIQIEQGIITDMKAADELLAKMLDWSSA